MIKRHKVKSCCGRSNLIFEAERPIRKYQLSAFEGAGYTAPENFKQIGIFYVRKDGIVATAPFGSRRITVYCHGDKCEEKLNEFATLLESAVNTNAG